MLFTVDCGYNIYRKLDDGQELHIAWRPNKESAERLVEELTDSWPAEYGIREAASRPQAPVPYTGRYHWKN